MTIHPITICGEPVLHTRAQPVAEYDEALRTLIDDMYAGTSEYPGADLGRG